MAKPNNRKAAGADEIVNGYMKHGREEMVAMMVMLYYSSCTWKNEYAPTRCRERAAVNLVKKRDKADPGNSRGMTLLNTINKTFCTILNDRMRTVMEEENIIGEQAGFRPNRTCADHVYTLGKIIQGGKDTGLTTYLSLIHI